jgi:hypothetical protein
VDAQVACLGFSLVFGTSAGGFIGNFDFIFLLGVDYTTCIPQHAPNIPGAGIQRMFV